MENELLEKGEESKKESSWQEDDLSKIDGIGPGRKKLLNEAGIHSFAQLAQSNPGQLYRAIGETTKFANVEHWVNQAKELLKGSE